LSGTRIAIVRSAAGDAKSRPNPFGDPKSFGDVSWRAGRFLLSGRNGPKLNMPNDTPVSMLFPIGSPVSPGPIPHRPPERERSENLPHKVPPRRPPSSSGAASNGGDNIFPTHLFDRPNSVLVYGPSRPLVNLALYAFAEATTPDFQWLDIGVPGEERPAVDPIQLGWIPEERLWLVDRPDALRPDDLTANLALFGLIRSDEPPTTLAQITEFLRLPDTSQRILSTHPNDGRPGAVAVTNAHRVMAAYPPHRVPPILALHVNAGFSVIVGYADSAGPGRNVFDFVFHLEGPSVSEWRQSHLVCEKGITSGPLRDGRPVALEEIALLANVLTSATSGH